MIIFAKSPIIVYDKYEIECKSDFIQRIDFPITLVNHLYKYLLNNLNKL